MTDKQTRTVGQPAGIEPVRAWETPRLRRVGHIGEVLQGGGGKLSPAGGDPGEMRVQKPSA